ncbi:hypothetical protein HU200_052110 [Digitaria exilis]|uniref:Uncharacterized protein n=1 Tax=Digitaria exilis TaxID=1010633 RepID=A0A835AM15_9POAL|nr:hypothetical protein HU200_052110 [Digitaria exilis]
MADSGSLRKPEENEEEDDIICLDPSFFVDRSYEMTTFTFGSHELRLLCLRAASTDYDLTGQLVWPGAVLMNNYLSEHPETVNECSVIELGSGIGITGILCSRFCKKVVLTDHNDEVLEARFKLSEIHSLIPQFQREVIEQMSLRSRDSVSVASVWQQLPHTHIIKKNIELQSCPENAQAALTAEKLEWGNSDHISSIIEKHPGGFDVVLGADIYILKFF